MTAARIAALAFTALVYGPPAAIVLATGLGCLRWAWRNERRHQKENGLPAAAA